MPKRAWLLATCLGLAGVTALTVSSVAGATQEAGTTQSDAPPPIVEENHIHPDADRILAERGIKLTTGDGHILLVDCPAAALDDNAVTDDVIRVRQNLKPVLCFKDNSVYDGNLKMEIPEVTFIKGDSNTLRVSISGQDTPIEIAKNQWTPLPGDQGSKLLQMVISYR